MEGFLIKGWDLILPEGGTGSMNPRLGVLHRAGRYRPWEPPCSSPVCWNCRCMVGFLVREWDLIFPGWCSLYKPQAGVVTPWEAVSTRRPPFSPPVCCSCICMEAFAIWGRERILLEGGTKSMNLRLGFPRRAGRYRPRGPPFSSPVCSCRCMEGFIIRG